MPENAFCFRSTLRAERDTNYLATTTTTTTGFKTRICGLGVSILNRASGVKERASEILCVSQNLSLLLCALSYQATLCIVCIVSGHFGSSIIIPISARRDSNCHRPESRHHHQLWPHRLLRVRCFTQVNVSQISADTTLQAITYAITILTSDQPWTRALVIVCSMIQHIAR